MWADIVVNKAYDTVPVRLLCYLSWIWPLNILIFMLFKINITAKLQSKEFLSVCMVDNTLQNIFSTQVILLSFLWICKLTFKSTIFFSVICKSILYYFHSKIDLYIYHVWEYLYTILVLINTNIECSILHYKNITHFRNILLRIIRELFIIITY